MFVVARHLQLVCLLASVTIPGLLFAGIWQDQSVPMVEASRGGNADTVYYRALKADRDSLKQALAAAPLERTASQGAILELPLPNGENQRFEVMSSPIMSPTLAARYPDIKTYRVVGVDDPAINGRLDMTPAGFHAMLSTPAGTVFVDPDRAGNYRSFYKKDYEVVHRDGASRHVCHTADLHQPEVGDTPLESLALRAVSTDSRRVYRLVIVTTGDYGAYFGSDASATAAIMTTINRVNQIYGRDLAVQLQLTDVFVYTDAASDPFSDTTDLIGTLLENQEFIDYAVGVDNYDIGHLFDIGGGGIAAIESVCDVTKAQGYTGHPTPDIGDPFDVDFVAHEMGHQLSATHTFNGTTDNCAAPNRTAATAVEPGSGSTIMAYAGICGGEDLQTTSEATFHAASIQQVNTYAFTGVGSSCGTLTSTGNGLPATIDGGADVTIPAQTPFVLTGTTDVDPDGDTLSYQWDQIDANGTGTTDSAGANPVGADYGDNPLFRSFVPISTPVRYFPRLSTLLSGATDIGETLPTTARTLHFRMTVRDGNSGVGDDDVSVAVDNTVGPFQVSGGALNAAANFNGGTAQTLTWDVNGTDVGCPAVSVSLLSLSSDASTYCDMSDDASLSLQTGINNNGATTVTLPDAQISNARVMLSCDNNIFFAVSANDFSVDSATATVESDCQNTDGTPLEDGTVFVQPSFASQPTGFSDGGNGAMLFLPLLLALAGLARLIATRRED